MTVQELLRVFPHSNEYGILKYQIISYKTGECFLNGDIGSMRKSDYASETVLQVNPYDNEVEIFIDK